MKLSDPMVYRMGSFVVTGVKSEQEAQEAVEAASTSPLAHLSDDELVTFAAAAGERSRRERIATAVLAGLVANSRYVNRVDDDARDAVKFADALIAELDK